MPYSYKDKDRLGYYNLTSPYNRGYTSESSSTRASEFIAAAIGLPLLLAAFTLISSGLLKLTFVISAPLCALVGAGIALQIFIPFAVGALLILATVATVVAISCAISALCSYLSNRSKAKDSATTDQTQTVAAAVVPSQALPEHVAPKLDSAANVLKDESNARTSITQQESYDLSKILRDYISGLSKLYPQSSKPYGYGQGICGNSTLQGYGSYLGQGRSVSTPSKTLNSF